MRNVKKPQQFEILSQQPTHEQLFVYLSSSAKAVSVPLIREDKGVQKPLYYVSKSMVGIELNYLLIKKLVLTLITPSIRLCYYFDAHLIKVITSTPIKASLRRSGLSGRKEKQSVELVRLHIEYEQRTSIKGQMLVEFIT